MSQQPSPTEELGATLDWWIPVVDPVTSDAAAWASRTARLLVTDRDLASTDVTRWTDFLFGLSRVGRPVGYTWRLLCVPDDVRHVSVWDVAFLQPDDASVEQLLGVDQPSQLGSDDSTFTWAGREGRQVVHFMLSEPAGADTDGSQDQSISAIARIAVTRDLPTGPTTLLARCETAHLEAMVASLVAAQYLLCSDMLAELVAPTSSSDDRV